MKRKIMKHVAILFATLGIILGTSAMAQAACWYSPPSSGYQVNYHQCKLVGFHYFANKPIYYCWADYDLWAEWTRGEVDRWVYIYGYKTCYA